MMGYAKWVNFEHLYLLYVLAFRSRKSFSDLFFPFWFKQKFGLNQKGCCQRRDWIQMDLPHNLLNIILTQGHSVVMFHYCLCHPAPLSFSMKLHSKWHYLWFPYGSGIGCHLECSKVISGCLLSTGPHNMYTQCVSFYSQNVSNLGWHWSTVCLRMSLLWNVSSLMEFWYHTVPSESIHMPWHFQHFVVLVWIIIFWGGCLFCMLFCH
jgi:hypothetical protein